MAAVKCAIVKCQKNLVIKNHVFVVLIRKTMFYCSFNVSEIE